MSRFRIVSAGALMAALALSGYKKPDEAPVKHAPPTIEATTPAPAGAASPMSYAQKTAAAEVTLKLPPAIATQPDLHARLYADGVRELNAFVEGAANERAEMEGEGAPTQPYERTITWTVGADTTKLLSLSSLQSEFTGGAHGNAAFGSVLWDKALKRTIAPTALFGANVDAAMDKALCDALIAEKKARLVETYTPPGPDWACPKWRDTPFELAASTVAGKAGGLRFLIGPYVAGAYAEGTYAPVVPFSAFARYLKPAYADEFAGSPRPTPAAAAQP